MRDPKRLWRIKPMLCRSRLPSAKSTAKVAPFSMRGVPAITANSRDGSRLLRFWVKAPYTDPEIGTTRLARARNNDPLPQAVPIHERAVEL
jgi:hypothetical protein